MKACLLSAPAPVDSNPLRYADVPTPQPADGDLLIRVHACGVCRTDLHVVEGELAPRKSPVIPGHQAVGVVEGTGQRVGVPWLHKACGVCEYCRAGKENLCDNALFTGWVVDGGYAQYIVAPSDFVYRLPSGLSDVQAAPLLCAGIIGFRSLRLSGIEPGGRLGFYGFGAAAHVAIQVARYWGCEVFAFTRDQRHQHLAMELGAQWAGGSFDEPPKKLDAAIIFAPAGELVPAALKVVKKGATVALAGIYMSPIPPLEYKLLYEERVVRSVANNTRRDGEEFLKLAAEIPVRTEVQVYPLEEANAALRALKHDAVRGAAVLDVP
jgi:alcohol dehydrogenase, propanol-preferring